MKTRIINGYEFGGVHQQHWLDANQNIIFAGELVSEWTLTDEIPSNDIVKPFWNGVTWVESETLTECNARKQQQAIQIDLEYTGLISTLMRKHMEKYIIDGVAIPQSVIDERDALRAECNAKINALGIYDYTYRQSVRGL